MIDLKISTPDFPQSESFRGLIRSMINKNFTQQQDIKTINVTISQIEDIRVPYKTTIELIQQSDKALFTESSSANYLASFSQALSRMERQLDRAA